MPSLSANFARNVPNSRAPCGERGRCCGAQAERTRRWRRSQHPRGRSGAPEWAAAAADLSPGSSGPASAGDSSRAGARPLFYGAWAPATAQQRLCRSTIRKPGSQPRGPSLAAGSGGSCEVAVARSGPLPIVSHGSEALWEPQVRGGTRAITTASQAGASRLRARAASTARPAAGHACGRAGCAAETRVEPRGPLAQCLRQG